MVVHPFKGVCPGLIHSSAESLHRWGAWWLELELIPLISAGPGGRCCRLVNSFWNRSEGLVPELSLIFCATGQECVQLHRLLNLLLLPSVSL